MPHQPKVQLTLTLESPWGWWELCTNENQVLALDYIGPARPNQGRAEAETKLEKRLDCMLSRYFRGEPVDFNRVPVDFSLVSPFQRQVLELLRTVPYGEVRYYQWLAQGLNKPNATRAVGGALGSNPWPIIIPCHRIISKTGALGGFMRNAPEGSGIKTGLLALEGVDFPTNKPASLLKAGLSGAPSAN